MLFMLWRSHTRGMAKYTKRRNIPSVESEEKKVQNAIGGGGRVRAMRKNMTMRMLLP